MEYRRRPTAAASVASRHPLGQRSFLIEMIDRASASIFKIMDQSRHRVDTLRGYVRDAELFRDNAGAGLL
jgi:hypothetical protein